MNRLKLLHMSGGSTVGLFQIFHKIASRAKWCFVIGPERGRLMPPLEWQGCQHQVCLLLASCAEFHIKNMHKNDGDFATVVGLLRMNHLNSKVWEILPPCSHFLPLAPSSSFVQEPSSWDQHCQTWHRWTGTVKCQESQLSIKPSRTVSSTWQTSNKKTTMASL